MAFSWKIGVLLALLALSSTAWCAPAPAEAPCPPAGCTDPPVRHRRVAAAADVMDTVKEAWSEVAGAVRDTGEKIKYAFQPTTSRVDGIIEGMKQAG